MSAQTQSIEATVAQHAAEIKQLTHGQTIMFEKLDSLAQKGEQTSVVLHQITQGLTELRAQKGPGLLSMLDVASRLVTLVGAVVVGVVYLATNGQSPAQHAVDKRVTLLEAAVPQFAEDRKTVLDLAKQQAVTEYRLKRAEEDQKLLRSSFGWKATVSQN